MSAAALRDPQYIYRC